MVGQGEPAVGGGGAPGGRASKRRSRSSGAAAARQQRDPGGGRESPIGAEREREFPTTKIGVNKVILWHLSWTKLLSDCAQVSGGPVVDAMPGQAGDTAGQYGMAAGYHAHHGRCGGASKGLGKARANAASFVPWRGSSGTK